jgi:hypothetical protein
VFGGLLYCIANRGVEQLRPSFPAILEKAQERRLAAFEQFLLAAIRMDRLV